MGDVFDYQTSTMPKVETVKKKKSKIQKEKSKWYVIKDYASTLNSLTLVLQDRTEITVWMHPGQNNGREICGYY